MSLYHPSQAKDSCGFGLIAQLDGDKQHQLIETAIGALTRMTHRGAVNRDGKSADGCGISIQLSPAFFEPLAVAFGFNLDSRFAVGQIFLNPDEALAQLSRDILIKYFQSVFVFQ